jgi:hypothetical protein
MGRPWCVGLIVAAVACSAAANTYAADDPPLRIAIVADPGTERWQNQIAEDLRSRGFEVVITDPGGGDERECASSATLRLGAVAVMRLKHHEELIEVWVSGSPDMPARMREAVAPVASTDRAYGDAVVQAVELMRASLIQVRRQMAAKAKAAESHAPEPIPEVAPAPRKPESYSSLAVSAGVGPLLASGGSTPAFGMPLDIRLALSPTWGVDLLGFVPLRKGWLQEPEATARVSPVLIGAGASATPWRGSILVPHIGASVQAALLDLSAEARPGFVGGAERRYAIVPALRAGILVRMTDAFGLRLEGWGGAAVPQTNVRFVDRKVGSWGPVVGSVALMVEVRAW